MNPDVALDPEFVTWLTRAEHEPVRRWGPDPPSGELRCSPELVARLADAARAIPGTARLFVAGCPVIAHPNGQPIAAAAGAEWLAVRSDLPRGSLASQRRDTSALAGPWVELEPFVADVSFARSIDLLRGHIARAFELAAAS